MSDTVTATELEVVEVEAREEITYVLECEGYEVEVNNFDRYIRVEIPESPLPTNPKDKGLELLKAVLKIYGS